MKAGEQESVLIVEYWYEIMFFYMEKYRDYPEDEILSRVGLENYVICERLFILQEYIIVLLFKGLRIKKECHFQRFSCNF